MSSDRPLTENSDSAVESTASANPVSSVADDSVTSEAAQETPTSSDVGSVANESAGPAESQSPPATADAPPAPVESADPVASAQPAESVQSTEPTPPAEPTQSTESSQPTESSPAEPRRRVQLNPSLDPSQVKAIPSVNKPLGKPPILTASGDELQDAGLGEELLENAEAAQQANADVAQPPSDPVEIPKTAELDADLEAEINAAMSGDTASPAVVAAPPGEPAGEPVSEDELEPGTRLKATVQSVHGDSVFLDLGFRSPGVVPLRQFESSGAPDVGSKLNVTVNQYNAAEGLILVNLPRGKQRVSGNWDEVTVGQVVDCMVKKTNKGGLEVSVGSLRGFMPAGQIDLNFISDMETFVGQKLSAKIIEANREKRNLVVSRRALLEEERKVAEQEIWKTLEVGQTMPGTVKTIKDYGVFVDLGGVDGFLHIGEISWTRVHHPSEVVHEGQQVDVKIISLDQEKKRIGLGIKQLAPNPWIAIDDNYSTGKSVSGRVSRTTDFGAFIELEPGVEGLVHISELDYKRVNKVTDVLQVGQEVEVQVLNVDGKRKRISLSVKALKAKPADAPGGRPSDEDLAPGGDDQYVRRRKGPLKGGTGSTGGGLFGNPSDFE